MSIYRYEMGGGTGSSMMGEPTGTPIEEQVEQMKSKILSALEGGASDKEIMMMVQESPLKDKYEFNWDNVEMKVEAYPIEEKAARGAAAGVGGLLQALKKLRGEDDERFGPKDPEGQRGDMFKRGGRTDQGGTIDQGGPRRTSSESVSPVLYDENDRPYVLNWMDVEAAGLGGNSDTFDISFDYGHAKKFEEGGVPRIYIEGDLVDQIKLNEGMGRLMLPTAMDFNVVKSNGRDVLQVRQ